MMKMVRTGLVLPGQDYTHFRQIIQGKNGSNDGNYEFCVPPLSIFNEKALNYVEI